MNVDDLRPNEELWLHFFEVYMKSVNTTDCTPEWAAIKAKLFANKSLELFDKEFSH